MGLVLALALRRKRASAQPPAQRAAIEPEKGKAASNCRHTLHTIPGAHSPTKEFDALAPQKRE